MPDADGPLLSTDFLKRLEQLELSARKVLAGRMKGDRLSKRKGRGSEFADFRPYTVGDDLRFLDWNLFGRVEKLFLRLYREEEDLHVYLLDRQHQVDGVRQPVEAALRQAGRRRPRLPRAGEHGPRRRRGRRHRLPALARLPRPAELVANDEARPGDARRRVSGDLNSGPQGRSAPAPKVRAWQLS